MTLGSPVDPSPVHHEIHGIGRGREAPDVAALLVHQIPRVVDDGLQTAGLLGETR